MEEQDDTFNTDRSLSKSTSLSFSELSSTRTLSSDDSLEEVGKSSTPRRRKVKKKESELVPPDEKLRRCEKRHKIYADEGNKDDAFSELLKLCPLVKLVYGDHNWKYADAHSKLATGYLEQKEYGAQAVKNAEKAKSVILSCDPPSDFEKSAFIKCVVRIYLCLGKALTFYGGKYKEAENSLLKSWQVLKSRSMQTSTIHIPSNLEDKDDLRTHIKLAMADVYIATKQSDKAVSCLQYVIKLTKERYSENDERLISLYLKLITAEKSRKKSQINYEGIVEVALKAHEISQACHALNSIEVADTAFTLGRSYASIDSDTTQSAAETYFNEALAMYKSILGDENPKALKVQDAIAKVWMRSEKENEAIQALKRSISTKAEVFGECSVEVANTHKLIGGVYLSKGDLQKAHSSLEKSLTIERELYGPQHWKTKATTSMINQVEQNPGFGKSTQSKLRERPRFSSTIKSVPK